MQDMFIKIIAFSFTLLGISFYASTFFSDYILGLKLEGISGPALYFANLAGALIIFTAMNLKTSLNTDGIQSKQPYFSYLLLFVLLAITRAFVFFNVAVFLPFIASGLAQVLMTAEFITFVVLSFIYFSRWSK